MNKSKLKTYAPEARRDFIQAVTQRANLLGLSATEIAPVQITGDIAMINGRPWPASVAQQRDLLVKRIQAQGFAAVMEAEAYGWFNRFAALRYMELHGYLDHGYRVLSNSNNADGAQGGLPEILENAASLDSASLPGLNRDEVIRLKLDGNKDNELYRLLLTTQCNALADGMGFLFETLGDETELLLPDNLLNTDSVIAKMVNSIDEADWDQVEIIGWLYQFYISDKKDEVIGKVVKSEDIPAATQLFTPNWIVKYLTQNSIGRLWLMANPSSNLASQMEYYIKPAEQTPEVNAQLDALIQTRMAEDGGSLNPETITVFDPACGSGHILVEAYDLLKAIYLERGYQPRAIPRLILEKNLFGLDIDDRAAQLAGFALLMKARADDRRLFESKLVLNVEALQDSHGLDDETMAQTVFDAAIALEGGEALPSGQLFGGGQLETQHSSGLKVSDLRELIQFFAHAKTFGSLLIVPESLIVNLNKLQALLCDVAERGNSLAQSYSKQILRNFTKPVKLLALQYDAVVANPPYMGGKYLTPKLKDFLKENFKGFEKDLFSAFMIRDLGFAKDAGQLGFMSPFVWMFISSYEELRNHFISQATLTTLVQLEYSGFDGATVPICTFTLAKAHLGEFLGSYIRLSDFRGADQQAPKTLEAIQDPKCGWFYLTKPNDFKKIPGSPVAYWVDDSTRQAFELGVPFGDLANPRQGMASTNNDKFLRFWSEVSIEKSKFNCESSTDAKFSGKKWFPIDKGGDYRKWFGNNEYVVNYLNDGTEMCAYIDKSTTSKVGANGRIINKDKYFLSGITWTAISSGSFSVRFTDSGHIFSNAGMKSFNDCHTDLLNDLAFLNSTVAAYFLTCLSQTLNFDQGIVAKLPVMRGKDLTSEAKRLVEISRQDWNFKETSWEFGDCPLISINRKARNLENSWLQWSRDCETYKNETKDLEEKINRELIDLYCLNGRLSPSVSLDKITLSTPNRLFDSQHFISYVVGCIMGRYSLDESGLIYAHASNVDFDVTRYTKFPADADGIVPVTDEYWFDDDAANRVREFLVAVWGEATLDENMNWLADSLGRKAGQNAEDAIRAYIAGSFFKDHLKTYKKRPIYWLFSSGKYKAFECLVYLHRYNEGTLARMRNEYVIPLAGKFGGRADLLQNQITNASTTSERNKLQKELDLLKKKQLELAQFDEQLRHYADQRISLDLDDGVKVNYGKFGNLLAEVKAITGGAGDE